MYKVLANNRQEYMSEAKKVGQHLEDIDTLIRECAPNLEPWFYNVGQGEPGMTFKMLGYGEFTYRPKKDSDEMVKWPVIGVALQKNYVSVYISVTKENKPILDFYRTDLKCTRSGNNNFSFKTLDQLNKDVLKKLIKEVGIIFKNDLTNPVHFKEN